MPWRLLRTCALMLIAFAPPSTAGADEPQNPVRPAIERQGSPDFLFGRPRHSISVRGSWLVPRGGSDWYDFVTDTLTVERGSFRSAGISGDVGIALGPALDLLIGADFTSRTTPSEYRNLVDNNRLPIVQSTQLRQAAVTGGVRVPLRARGRDISSLAWIPARWVPYAGAGGGILYYRLRQSGDFVDIVDNSIFTDVIASDGWTPVAYVHGGIDLQLVRQLYLTVDGRYQWADAKLSNAFQGFERHDLAGFRLSGGINIVF